MTNGQKERRVRVERTIGASAERVFRAWTDPEELPRWFAPEGFTIPAARADARPGGAFRIVMRSPDGTEHVAVGSYREVEPPTRLVFTWAWDPPMEGEEGETRVTVELTESGGSTRLVLVHDGFVTEAGRESHEEGWTSLVRRLDSVLQEAE